MFGPAWNKPRRPHAGASLRRRARADSQLDDVLLAVIHQIDDVLGGAALVAHHGDAVGRLAIAVAQLEPRPARRQARRDAQPRAFAREAEERFEGEPGFKL